MLVNHIGKKLSEDGIDDKMDARGNCGYNYWLTGTPHAPWLLRSCPLTSTDVLYTTLPCDSVVEKRDNRQGEGSGRVKYG